MPDQLKLSIILPVKAEQLYLDWLDSVAHGAFTGSAANIKPVVGGQYTAWDGYISGKTLELDPPRRILQSWRSTDFPSDAPESLLEVLIEPDGDGCRLTLVHTNIPDGQGKDYDQGWKESYFEPMEAYYRQ